MEYKMAAAVYDTNEFFEGIRALLIDKDQKPDWHFKSVSQIE